jgi:hypothetical protein
MLRRLENQEPDCLWFGKYKNVPIDDVPTDYLIWAVDNWEGERSTAYELVENELIKRKQRGLA